MFKFVLSINGQLIDATTYRMQSITVDRYRFNAIIKLIGVIVNSAPLQDKLAPIRNVSREVYGKEQTTTFGEREIFLHYGSKAHHKTERTVSTPFR